MHCDMGSIIPELQNGVSNSKIIIIIFLISRVSNSMWKKNDIVLELVTRDFWTKQN